MIPYALNLYVVAFKNIEKMVAKSRINLLRNNSKLIIGILSILILTYFVSIFVYIAVTFIPIFLKILSFTIESIESVSKGRLAIPENIISRDLFIVNLKKLIQVNVVISINFVTFVFVKGISNSDLLVELDILHNIVRSFLEKKYFPQKFKLIMTVYLIVMLFFLGIILPFDFYINHIVVIIAVLFTCLIIMLIFQDSVEDNILSRKFIFQLFVSPLLVISIVQSTEISFNNPITLIILIISLFALSDSILSEYIRLRNNLFNGSSILFAIMSFKEDDYDCLWKKIRIKEPELIESNYSEILMYGLVAFNKKNPDIEISKKCLKYCAEVNREDTTPLYLLGNLILSENNETALKLFKQVKKQQSNSKNSIYIEYFDINSLILNCLSMNVMENKNEIISLLGDCTRLPKEEQIILAEAYIYNDSLSLAKEILMKIKHRVDYCNKVPYLLVYIALCQHKSFSKEVEKNIKISESYGIKCDDLIKKFEVQ